MRAEGDASRDDRGLLRLALLLGTVQLALLVGHIVAYGPIGAAEPSAADGVLNFHRERTVPTYWSGIVFALTAGAAVLASLPETGLRRLQWLAVAAGFAWLAVEEVPLGLHEQIGRQTGMTWTAVYAPFLCFGAWLAWRCASELDRRHRRLALIGLACLVVAVVGEASGRTDLFVGWRAGNAVRDLLEENLELAGAVLLLIAFAGERRSLSMPWQRRT